MNETILTPQELIDRFTRTFGDLVSDPRIQIRAEGAKKNPNTNIWMTITRDILKPAISMLKEISYPHLSVISGWDVGEELRMQYIFSIYFGERHGEYMVIFTVPLTKGDLVLPTITDIMPGALFTEREKQEMFGVTITDIPDGRRLFLPEDFPEGVYPLRKDETGIPDTMVKHLWEVGRPTNRPVPPVTEKEEEPKDDPEEKTVKNKENPSPEAEAKTDE
ncbi:MAG: NADH dehydrogenase (Ubiquinone) 30 kDa subunit [Methanomicrobiales archaeon 53_19]|uniref:NADH-quinone oxidoreductase subunit C n=1 Tax=Methanocalculus sp. TaxID=2004547 RepID=UPI0007469F03|nr:NADH-quinone oxidoreductase subunit C [Methanocalculus sp.]KUK70656.1 MAG: NADH dehydrogenase (Ubiquinone) 30 kDa subunit [Methanocalculus sp. 52_23]KUL03273.1 MAG: NADH dehydrogenase (Ubiquinone) 30 kDa subunit [Methanomicrobiales archaeon 53_19]HIJ07278.1 NADH-quinone oxidoreductase subunit C [Methanocalculus sp.]